MSTAVAVACASASLSQLPPLGAAFEGGAFAGLTTKPDGTHCAVVLLPDKPAQRLTWSKAMAWAKKLDFELPSRPVSALLFANAKADFEPEWHWTCEAYNGSCAWNQNFFSGGQHVSHKSFEGRARAVRLIQITT